MAQASLYFDTETMKKSQNSLEGRRVTCLRRYDPRTDIIDAALEQVTRLVHSVNQVKLRFGQDFTHRFGEV